MKVSRRELLGSFLAGGILMRAQQPSDIQRFRINFSKADIEDLHRRLDRIRWPEVPFDTGWSAGTNLPVLRELAQYWRQKFDWFRIQDDLNALPHFRTWINGEGLHFIHFRGTGSDRRFPILLLHGWPGSFVEFLDGAATLSKRFDLVIPSLPGFGLSDVPKTPGMHSGKMGEHLHLLMQKLGYSRYGLQGGDWGAATAMEMARRTPESIAGLHINFCTEAPEPAAGGTASEQERAYRTRIAQWRTNEFAYFDQQSTRPQTLAYGLTDSPVGTLAWITEQARGGHFAAMEQPELWSSDVARFFSSL